MTQIKRSALHYQTERKLLVCNQIILILNSQFRWDLINVGIEAIANAKQHIQLKPIMNTVAH